MRMSLSAWFPLAVVGLLLPLLSVHAALPSDEDLLKRSGVQTDTPSLLAFLRRERDPAPAGIPDLIRKLVDSSGEVVLWGDGSPTREFLYVDDCAEGIVLAAERYDGPDPVNLGTGEEISIRDLAELIGELTGYDGEIVWDTSKPNGQPRRKLDVTRAEQLFGFHARTSLRAGLAKTIEWYRAR